jgi:hypothetical protein
MSFNSNNILIGSAKIPFWQTNSSGTVSINTTFTGTAQIDWGDGTISSIVSSNSISHTFTGSTKINYVFSNGNSAITRIAQPNPIGNKVGGSINVSRFQNLNSLSLGQYNLSSVIWNYNSTLLTYINFANNAVTGSIPGLDNHTALSTFICNANQLTGNIPSLNSNTSIVNFTCNGNQLTGSIPSLSNNTALTTFNCQNNSLSGSIPNLSNNTSLASFLCHANNLTDFSGGTVSSTLGDFRAYSNRLTSTAINAILAAFVAAGRTSSNGTCILNLGPGGNAAPTGQGITDKNTLISRGWTVTTS